jgi:hypothetical protein
MSRDIMLFDIKSRSYKNGPYVACLLRRMYIKFNINVTMLQCSECLCQCRVARLAPNGKGTKLGEGEEAKLGEGEEAKLGEGCPKVRLSQDRMPISSPSPSLAPFPS